MPPYPEVSHSVSSITGSVYSGLAHKLAQFEGETYPLHIGDTWLEPASTTRSALPICVHRILTEIWFPGGRGSLPSPLWAHLIVVPALRTTCTRR